MAFAMFPGQGSQHVGMGKELLELFPYVQRVFEEAEDAANMFIRRLCFDGPAEELSKTANTQPAILTVSTAVWRVLQEEAGFKPSVYAGHSLGEYSALVAAEVMSLADAARLVRQRGIAMQEAVPVGVGAMAAVMKIPSSELELLCSQVSSSGNVVEVVNYNSDGQNIVSGHKEAVAGLGEVAKSKGARVVPLDVSAPFHSSLMSPAREAMTAPLKQLSLNATAPNSIIPNITGKVCEQYEIDYLVSQIDSPVRWAQTMEVVSELGCDVCVEVGPGKVLSGLAKRGIKAAKIHNTSEDLKSLVSVLQRL